MMRRGYRIEAAGAVAWLAWALAAGPMASGPAWAQAGNGPAAGAPADPAARLPESQAEIKLSFAPLVRETTPAVVNVYAAKTVPQRSLFSEDPFFEQFFGQRFRQQPRIQSSLGSGVIVDPTGLIVTNNHVVADADEVRVALSDGREFTSKILLKDERADLAVLKIEAKQPLPALAIADSDRVEIGDLVLAVGNPFGVGQTVTNGIVSALARTHIGADDFGYFIQTDAAINPGNSGGALIDMRGHLIGINSAIYSRSGGSIGIGFAIPSNMVRAFLEAARRGERFQRPFIGATFVPLTSDIADAVGADRPRGALVESTYPKGPSEAAGLRPGDVVESIDGFPVADPDVLGYRLATAGLGRTVDLGVLAPGGRKTLRLVLNPPPETPPRDLRKLGGETPFAGSTVANLSPRVADEVDLPQSATGVVVLAVERGSFADRFGLQPKDIVRRLNGRDIASTQELATQAAEAGRGWAFDIERDGRILTQRVR